MEEQRVIINQFLKAKHTPSDLKEALFKAAEAAREEGWTYMEAAFQLGDHAKEEGLSQDDADSTIRRAFAAEKRTKEREKEAAGAAATVSGQSAPQQTAAPVQTIVQPMAAGMLPLEQLLAMGLDSQSLELLQNHKIDPEALSIPWPTPDWRKDLAKLLSAVFDPEETIEFKISNTPTAYSEKVSTIVGQSDAIKKTMKNLDGEEGAILCINAAKAAPGAKGESWRFRYAVVDNPKMSLAKQLAYYKALNLPCAALVNTGANSVQAWVKILARDREEYDARVDFLFSTLDSQGFKVDDADKNPSQMVRMPGVLRNGKQQYLIGLEQGAKSFPDWQEWVEYCLDGKPLIELASDNAQPPRKDSKIIDDVLSAGEFLLFTAPPKAGKSFALMDLALSICNGANWLGLPTTRNDVLFINFESTKSALVNRFHTIAEKRGLPTAPASLGFLNLRGAAMSPLEMAQLIAKRIRGAKKLEDHDYKVVIIDPIASVLHNPKTMRNASDSHLILMQMIDTLIALTGCAVVTCMNTDEYPHLASHADSLISLQPMEGCPNVFQIRGEFREFPSLLSRECSWRFPCFVV